MAARQPWEKGFVAGIYVLTAADVKAGAIRFGKARFLFDAGDGAGRGRKRKAGARAAGATGKATGAGASAEPMTVEFVPGGPVQAPLSGKGKTLEDATLTRAFFEATGAKAGDRLLVERAGARHIRVSKSG